MSYIRQVAKMLGVALEEKFNIQDHDRILYYHGKPIDFWFSEDGLHFNGDPTDYSYFNEDLTDYSCFDSVAIGKLINGVWTIVRIPWKPDFYERYYYIHGDEYIFSINNAHSVHDAVNMSFGNCFRTKEEAEAHKEEILRKAKTVFDKE